MEIDIDIISPRDSEYDNCKETYFTFRMRADDLQPAEITALLGVEPTNSFFKGEEYSSRGRRMARPWGVWHLSSENMVKAKNPELHALWLLEVLEPHRKTLLAFMEERDIHADIHFWWKTGETGESLALSSDTVGRLCALTKEFIMVFLAMRDDDADE